MRKYTPLHRPVNKKIEASQTTKDLLEKFQVACFDYFISEEGPGPLQDAYREAGGSLLWHIALLEEAVEQSKTKFEHELYPTTFQDEEADNIANAMKANQAAVLMASDLTDEKEIKRFISVVTTKYDWIVEIGHRKCRSGFALAFGFRDTDNSKILDALNDLA